MGDSEVTENVEVSSANNHYFKTDEATLAALFETIMVSTAPVLANIVKQNPGIVHAKVWHGITLLHKLCMRGDEAVVSLLLQSGADPTARTDAGEAPLHYACRKGRLPVVVALLKAGGDVLAVDSTGHNCMHYAAQGGFTAILVYLNETCGLEYNVFSSAVQTPLHVVAIHGHWQTAAFLLRKQRCQVDASDVMGNTALHLAALHGHLSVCWQIIASGRGSQCLTAVNGQKQRPLEMMTGETSTRHQETQRWMKQFTEQQSRSGAVTSPKIIMIFNLLFPVTISCFLPAVLSWLVADFQSLIFMAGIIVMMRWLVQQDHRLSHPSRWPNPARAGVFIWGITANLICYFYYLQPFYLTHWTVNWASWTALFLFLLSLVSFFRANAGTYKYETTPAVSQSDGRQMRDWTGVIQGTVGCNFCDECELIQEYGVRHCRMCGACFRNLDHHCLFLLRCVTATNGRHFLLFLLTLFAVCSAYVVNIMLYLEAQKGDGATRTGNTMWQLLTHNTLVLIMFCADLIGIVWAILLSHHQMRRLPGRNGGSYGHSHQHKQIGV